MLYSGKVFGSVIFYFNWRSRLYFKEFLVLGKRLENRILFENMFYEELWMKMLVYGILEN